MQEPSAGIYTYCPGKQFKISSAYKVSGLHASGGTVPSGPASIYLYTTPAQHETIIGNKLKDISYRIYLDLILTLRLWILDNEYRI
jgi:hypothetical protein